MSMAKKVKPYENNNRNRTLPNSSSKKNNNNHKNNIVSKEKKKNLEKTTKFKFDFESIPSEKSLDTSFLEGRVQNKGNKKERDKILKERQEKARNLELLKYVFFFLSFFCVIVLIGIILWNQSHLDKPIEEESKIEETSVEIDDNYLFIGDSHVTNLSMDHFSYPHVVVAGEEMTTEWISADFHHTIYIYNPSVVIIELGLEDLANEYRIEEIVDRYSMILKEIQENRPNAHVYIESVYPIHSSKIEENSRYSNINNATIKSLNKELKSLASTYHYHYVDLYSNLSDEDSLKDSYSDNGITLNEAGYQVVWKAIDKIVKEEQK